MATTDTDSVHDHMTNLRLKMVQQKIQNERDRLANRPPSEESTNDDLERQARLQQAMLRRQELLDKIRREQLLNDDGRRPASDRSRRRYTPSPLPVPPSRRSLPDFARYNNYYNYNQQPDTFRSKPDMSQVKHVIEHKIATPRGRPQYPLPPINLPPGPPPPPIIIPAPAPQIMQQPAPQYIQTAPQHIIQQVPNPIIQDLTPQQNRGMFNKAVEEASYMDVLMAQNAQLQRMVLKQLGAPRASGNVHHHHYTSPPPSQPAVHHYTTMPTMDIRGGYPLREGSKQMKVKPGSRQAKGRQAKKTNLTNRPSSMFLFGIILKEIVAALHRIYLNPNGNIYPVLNDVIGPNCYDLAELIHGGRGLGGKEESVLIQELQYVLENLVYHITEIMPSTGVLGTHRKSAVFELIRSGKRFPDGYFWQVEMDRLQFTDQGRTVNVGDTEGFLLMLGIFISRSLVTTILMKPMDYGLSNSPLSEVAERNLRVVATTLLYLVRRISIARGHGIMPVPTEIAEYLYTDEEMDYIYSKLARTFNYSEGLLREWGTEYTRRLRGSSMQT